MLQGRVIYLFYSLKNFVASYCSLFKLLKYNLESSNYTVPPIIALYERLLSFLSSWSLLEVS